MGIGLVLIFWAFVGFLLAMVAGLISLGIFAILIPRKTPRRGYGLLFSALLPFVLLFYFGIAFVGYAMLSYSRGYDPGIGDSWQVPLGGGYSLVMIDTPEQASISMPNAEDISIGKLTKVGVLVIGEQRKDEVSAVPARATAIPPGYFILDTSTKSYATFTNKDAFQQALSRHGLLEYTLLTPEEYYQRHRFGWFDGIAAGVILIPPALAMLLFLKYLLTLHRASKLKN